MVIGCVSSLSVNEFKKTILYSEGSICRSTIFAKLPHIMNFDAQFAPFLLSKVTVVYREATNTI